MNRKEKEMFVASMNSRLQKAQATFLVDYQGLDVEAINSLRSELKKQDTDFHVVKNRLLKLASQDTETAALEEHFAGPCAVAITYDDVVAPAKALVEQGVQNKNLEIKAGQIGGKTLDFVAIKRLAELPGRDVLLSQVLSAMQAVPTSFVRVLNGAVAQLVYVLKALEKQKEDTST